MTCRYSDEQLSAFKSFLTDSDNPTVENPNSKFTVKLICDPCNIDLGHPVTTQRITHVDDEGVHTVCLVCGFQATIVNLDLS